MALGTDDEQTAGILDLGGLLLDLALVAGKEPLILGSDGQDLRVVGFGIGVGLL